MRRLRVVLLVGFLSLLAASAAADKPGLVAGLEQVFDRPAELAALRQPTICVLDIQHPDLILKQIADKPVQQYGGRRTKSRMKEITGLPCLLVHFTEVKPQQLEQPNVKAILITGRSKVVSKELDGRFYPLIRTTRIPVFGFCGGMQLIGEAFSAKVEPMRKLREGEKDPNPKYHPGSFKEWGFMPVKVTKRDPLFAGLPDEVLVREAHAFHVLEPPSEFALLASTTECRVQAIKHKDRLLYGTQFHPEAYDDAHPHGKVVLQNFFRIVQISPGKCSAAQLHSSRDSGTCHPIGLPTRPRAAQSMDQFLQAVRSTSSIHLGALTKRGLAPGDDRENALKCRCSRVDRPIQRWAGSIMSEISLSIPERSLLALKVPPEQVGGEIRLAAAMKLYELGRLSSGAAAELAGIPRCLFLTKLADYGIDTFRLTEEDLKSEAHLA